MASNGRLPASDLAPIGGGYFLRKDAAAAFNAMSEEALRKFGTRVLVISAYRTLDKQIYLWDHVAHAHDPNWVARPGTSNHGWGLAVDLASPRMRQIVDSIGAKYGFAKRWSDAPVEWWHIKWREGVWKGHAAPAADPLSFLTKEERDKVREYKHLKATNQNKARRGQLWRWFIERRKNIYRAAQDGSWDRHNRRKRYSYFYKLTK